MRGDKGGDADEPGTGGGRRRRRNPYPMPGQRQDPPGAGPPADAPPSPAETPPPIPGMPPGKGGRGDFAANRLSVAGGPAWLWLALFVPFLVAILVIFAWGGLRLSGAAGDGDRPGPGARPPGSPRPEPVSTVPPEVEGWKAVSSEKYGMTYDVPASWRVLPAGVLTGWEAAGGGRPAMMSTVAVFRDDMCRDGDDERSRAHTGFNQYRDGGLAQAAGHAANKFATNAYTDEGDPAPVVTLSDPETVKVGRDEAVHVRADVDVQATGPCHSPSAVVHTVAVRGVAPGLTTVLILQADQGVPDAAPKAEIEKILGTLRRT